MSPTYYSSLNKAVSPTSRIRQRASACGLALVLICAPSLPAQQPNAPLPRPWMDLQLSPDARAGLVLQQMTLDEKISMVHGAEWDHNIWVNGKATPVPTEMVSGAAGFVPGVKRLGVPAIQMVDAALGITRGSYAGRYSTVLPSALSGASGWDPRLSYDYGALVGHELLDAGFNMSLGGGVNLDREPRNGRNFEYKGEDPILAGTLVGAEINGLQAQGVIGDIKHFAVNDQETQRNAVNALLDLRSMRETDLLAFEIGIRDSHPAAVMCSYNKLNGPWACDSPTLLNGILKTDLGFQGFVLSDWKATHSAAIAANAGLDMEQPDGANFGAPLKAAVTSGTVPAARLDDMVRRILRAEFTAGLFDRKPSPHVTDIARGLAFAQRVAESGTVLLKNDHNTLPLNPAKLHTLVLIGGHADVAVLAGGGSAEVDPPGGPAVPQANLRSPLYDPSSPLRALQALLPGVTVTYIADTDPGAASAARKADAAIVFAVQPSREDTDLTGLSLPNKQDDLIAAIAAANPHTVVVLETGSAVTMPWEPTVPAIVELWYPGIRGAEAIANILLGKVNPSGKLPITFPRSEQDLPRPILTGLKDVNPTVDYNIEGLKVGYKWFDAEHKTPLFAFGHGLSYTHFAYSALHIDPATLTLTFDLRNTGKLPGDEIAEVYVSLPTSTNEPPKRLVGWQKTRLAPDETKHITLKLDPLYLAIFDVPSNRWKTVAGTYTFRVGGSSDDLPLTTSIDLAAH